MPSQNLVVTDDDDVPDRALFADPEIRRLVEQATPSAPLIGVTRGHTPVVVR